MSCPFVFFFDRSWGEMYVLCVFLSSCRSLFIFISLFTISFVFVFLNRPSFYHTNTNDTMTSPPWRPTSLVTLDLVARPLRESRPLAGDIAHNFRIVADPGQDGIRGLHRLTWVSIVNWRASKELLELLGDLNGEGVIIVFDWKYLYII